MKSVCRCFLVLLCCKLFFLVAVVQAAENIVQLPHIVTPISYQLTILPVLENNPRLCGHVWIDIVAHLETGMIILHAADLTVIKAVVVPSLARNEPALNVSQRMTEDLCFNSVVYFDMTTAFDDISDAVAQDGQKELMTIILRKNLIRDRRYRIGILYTGSVYDKGVSKGFFRTQYEPNTETDCCKRTIGATQLEALHARKLFPCVDEPTYKATFRLSVGHSKTLTALANMPLQLSSPMTTLEDWVWDTFEASPVMSTYLLASVLTDFEYLETYFLSMNGQNVSIRLWTTPNQLDYLKFALNLVPKILNSFEDYLQVPYPLPKLDIITIPGYDNGKAMENWGLIIHSEDSLLVDESSDDMEIALVAVTVVHEIGHQWFGNLVTSSWWDDIWLNEGLTTFFESIILEQVAPEIQHKSVLVAFLQEVLKADFPPSSHALGDPVSKYETIDEKFDTITYSKGAAIFRMAQSFVGEEAFQTAIRRYFTKFQYTSANSTDFWNLINQEARKAYAISGRMNVNRIMKTWTQQIGYPLVHVHRKNNMITIRQTPFNETQIPVANETTAGSPSWWIPISMADAESLKFSPKDRLPIVWLTPKKPSVEIPTSIKSKSWVLVNIESSGYYRVNYDRQNWKLISEQLHRDHTTIPFLTRAQLVDDAFILAHAQIIPYDVALEIIGYLANTDDDFLIRRIAQNHIEQMQSIDENTVKMSKNEKNFQNIRKSPNQEKKLRYMPLPYLNGQSNYCDTVERVCANEALLSFHSFMNDSSTLKRNKSQNLESIWCTAIRFGGDMEWLFAWNFTRFHKSNWPERRIMLKAMCCTKDLGNIRQLVARMLNPNIKQTPKETLVIMKNLANNSSARLILLEFIMSKSNWNFLEKHLPKTTAISKLLMDILKKSSGIEEEEKNFVEEIVNKLKP